MKWVSFSGEFAFLSVGGSAEGIIAIGGVSRGIVAIGGIACAGVISIGMNAVGSVAALGMNAVAPISISLINGLGIYALAGVNGWGAWSRAGTNSTGLDSRGGVNSDLSIVPAVLVIVISLVVSSVLRGRREVRMPDGAVSLRHFSRSPHLVDTKVRARLEGIRDGGIELVAGRTRVVAQCDPSTLERARSLVEPSESEPLVVANLVRVEELVPTSGEAGYRERPAETTHVVVRCLEIMPAPRAESWLPRDPDEVQWVIAWSARIAALVSIGLVVWWKLR